MNWDEIIAIPSVPATGASLPFAINYNYRILKLKEKKMYHNRKTAMITHAIEGGCGICQNQVTRTMRRN